MEQAPQRIRLRLPEQDLHHLTLGSTQPKKMQEWVDALPMVNVGECSRQLYQLVQELARLRIDGRSRLALLEIVRPALMLVCRQLSKHYLNQSVVLPEKSRKVVQLTESLVSHLALGYKLVVTDCIPKARDRDQARAALIGLHRAMSAMSDSLLRSYQLYLPTPRFLWLELHQLFLMAEAAQLADAEVEDKEFRHVSSSTVRDAYARALLLSTARVNQLRQQEIALVWDATEEWCGLAEIRGTGDDSDIFAFDLQLDAPPTYRKLASQHKGETLRAIDARAISAQLRQAGDTGKLPDKGAPFCFPRGFSRELALHLAQAWGNLTERAFSRVAATGSLEVCVGLGAMHHFLSDGADFDTQLRGGRLRLVTSELDNPFLKPRAGVPGQQVDVADVWSEAFDGGSHRMASDVNMIAFEDKAGVDRLVAEKGQAGPSRVRFDSATCDIVNASPGGYCLQWNGEMPGTVRTGELAGLRGNEASPWSIGVIRWIKQLPGGKGAQLGIELLAPRATPCGARVIKQGGEMTEWMRVLMLPELRAIGQEATLVTPSIAFATGYKVMLNIGGRETRVALYRQLNATPGFRQFLFRDLDAPLEGDQGAGAADTGKDDFDSIWSNL